MLDEHDLLRRIIGGHVEVKISALPPLRPSAVIEPARWGEVIGRYRASTRPGHQDGPSLREICEVIMEMHASPMRLRAIGARFGKNAKTQASKLWVSKFLGLRRLTEQEWALVEKHPGLAIARVYAVSCMPQGPERWTRLNKAVAIEARRRSKKAFQEYLRTIDDAILVALVESDPAVRRAIEDRLNDIIDAAETKLQLIGGRRRFG